MQSYTIGSSQSVAVSARLRRSPCFASPIVRRRPPVRAFLLASLRSRRGVEWRTASPPLYESRLFSLSGEVSKAPLWWEKDADLWCDVSAAPALEEALRCPEYEICVVDWFATWCHGCRKTSPHLKELAADPTLNTRVKFVRACVDGMADFARRQGVKALPYLSIYDNTGRKLLAFGAAASKHRTFRANIEKVLEDPSKDFRLDPNGYVVALNKVEATRSQFEMKMAVEELKNFKTKLEQKMASESVRPPPPPINMEPPAMPIQRTKALIRARQEFLDEHGRFYGYRGLLHSMYDYELGRRLGHNQHYLDYTGSSVYTETQLTAIMKDFRENMFGNPHSENPSSSLSRDRIEEVRRMVLDFFDADPREYQVGVHALWSLQIIVCVLQVIFTKSATTALKIIGETYPWSEKSLFRYLRENHNSVLGIREYVLKSGGRFEDITEEGVNAWMAETPNEAPSKARGSPNYHLFAYPAEENFAGVKYPLSWIKQIQKKSTAQDVWKVMLDAAAFVSTQPLSLREFPADYVAISFYKMFGYPTGLGALIVRIDDIDILKKVFWAGGSVALATPHDNFHILKCRPTERLEDGTVAFLDIISLKHGFEALSRCGGMLSIQRHVHTLSEWLHRRLSSMRHSNGQPIVKIFGKHGQPDSIDVQGGILNFELLGSKGKVQSYKTFEKDAAKAGFHVRTGIECNPGAAYNYIGIQESEVESLAGLTEGCEDELEYIQVSRSNEIAMFASVDSSEHNHLKTGSQENGFRMVNIPLGSVRLSLGYLSTFDDCYAFANFLEARCKDRDD